MSRFNVNKHAAYKALKTAVTNLFVDSLAIKQLMKKQENQRK
jgi:hypothetical protein